MLRPSMTTLQASLLVVLSVLGYGEGFTSPVIPCAAPAQTPFGARKVHAAPTPKVALNVINPLGPAATRTGFLRRQEDKCREEKREFLKDLEITRKQQQEYLDDASATYGIHCACPLATHTAFTVHLLLHRAGSWCCTSAAPVMITVCLLPCRGRKERQILGE
jgi:hypothetical protein